MISAFTAVAIVCIVLFIIACFVTWAHMRHAREDISVHDRKTGERITSIMWFVCVVAVLAAISLHAKEHATRQNLLWYLALLIALTIASVVGIWFLEKVAYKINHAESVPIFERYRGW
jgi:cytochrome bd-type quinol oxidase subunit 2